MKATLPRTLSLLCLACLASAGRADSPSTPIPAAASDGVAQPRRGFSFLRKLRVQRTTRQSPPVVSAVVLSGLFGGGSALWLLLRMVRYRLRAGSGSDGKMLEQQTAAQLGTLFGFPAGMCVYDQLCPRSPSPDEPEA